LGEVTGLPAVELEKVFWQPALAATPRDLWVAIQERLAAEEEWIMDGDLGTHDVGCLGSRRLRQVVSKCEDHGDQR